MLSWFKRRAGDTGPKAHRRPLQARDISIDFLGEIGTNRSVEDYVREIEVHRWELEHRINQIADHLSVGRKEQASSAGSGVPAHDHVPPIHAERDRHRNIVEAKLHPEAVAASGDALDAFQAQLPKKEDRGDAGLVPQIFHFAYGFRDRGDLPYFGYMAIKSALHFNPGWSAYLHCIHVPEGPIWDRIKSRVEVIRLDDFTYFRNARFHHYAHKADVVRLLAINLVGGVYLDIDTITQKPFESLRRYPFTMGVQASGSVAASGLCNAVMIGQPGAVFSTRWLEAYDTFRSQGRDDLWDYHSVKLPGIMMAQAPEAINVLEYRAFFYPLWESIEAQLFTDRGAERFADHFGDAYCFHLWHGGTSDFLSKVDDNFVRTSRSIYASIAREVEGLTP